MGSLSYRNVKIVENKGVCPKCGSDDFKMELYGYFFQDKRGVKIVELGTKWDIHLQFKDDKCCDRCKEVKPALMFQILKPKNQRPYQSNICRKCELEKIKLYQKTPKGKAKNLRNFQKWVSKNRDNWNSYNRERSKKEKELLTDSYIKKLLRAKYGKGYKVYDQETIINYRNKVLQKRKLSIIKKSVNF